MPPNNAQDLDGDTPYMELYDGTTWRLTNGERDEVGLMTTARLGALMTNAGRTADGELLDPTCPCCGRSYDTARHMMLDCAATTKPRNAMETDLAWILEDKQRLEYRNMAKQDKYMTLLGKQMENELTLEQQMRMDSSVKRMLKAANTLRTTDFDQQPLTGKLYTRPPEHTAQLLHQWQTMEDERLRDLREEQMDGSDGEEEEPATEDEEDETDWEEEDEPVPAEEQKDGAGGHDRAPAQDGDTIDKNPALPPRRAN